MAPGLLSGLPRGGPGLRSARGLLGMKGQRGVERLILLVTLLTAGGVFFSFHAIEPEITPAVVEVEVVERPKTPTPLQKLRLKEKECAKLKDKEKLACVAKVAKQKVALVNKQGGGGAKGAPGAKPGANKPGAKPGAGSGKPGAGGKPGVKAPAPAMKGGASKTPTKGGKTPGAYPIPHPIIARE